MAASLAVVTFIKTMKKAHVELLKMKMAVDIRNQKVTHHDQQESTEDLSKEISCTFSALGMVESLVASRGHPDLTDVDMLEMILPKCIGYWRTFEIISEDDEEMFRGFAGEIVIRYRPTT